MNKPIKKSKGSALSKVAKKKFMWLGAQSLMTNGGKERELIITTSQVLRVSPFGVNILGNLPYINKLGLMQKATEYSPGVTFKYNWIRRAEGEDDKAICECKVVNKKGKDITDWVTGECSPSTLSMSTLKGYQNHLAQTRAKNRAINEAFGAKIHEDMMSRLYELTQKGSVKQEQAELIAGSSSTSAEEIEKSISHFETSKDQALNIALKQIEQSSGKTLLIIESHIKASKDFDEDQKKKLFEVINKKKK